LRRKPMPTLTLSEAARALLGRRLAGDDRVTPENLAAYRELARAGIMVPISTWAGLRGGDADPFLMRVVEAEPQELARGLGCQAPSLDVGELLQHRRRNVRRSSCAVRGGGQLEIHRHPCMEPASHRARPGGGASSEGSRMVGLEVLRAIGSLPAT
jgi:hypothetical protein